VVKFFIFILIFVFDPMAVALVIAYNITMVNRQQGSLDGGTTVNPTKKKKPKRLGLYKEGKSMMEKIVKETFVPDDDGEVKKADEVIKEVIEEESVGGKDQTKLQGLRGESKSTSPKSYQIENK
jgi:hypothetical protein